VTDTLPTPVDESEYSPVDAIAHYLADCGFGELAVDLFADVPPDDTTTPDAAIGVAGRPGLVDETFSETFGRPNATVVVRGDPNRAGAAERRAWAVWKALSNIANEEIHGVTFLRIQPSQTPGPLGPDSKTRETYTFDLEIYLDAF
jgi:hypothetical protein